jgi:dUTPase
MEKSMNQPTFKFALREDLQQNKEFLPTKGEPNATGYDVRAAFEDKKSLVLKPTEYFKIPLGFRCMPESGWWYQVHPRSSSLVKKNLHCLIGIVDISWEGETLFCGQYFPELSFSTQIDEEDDSNDWVYIDSPDLTINFGDHIGQIIPVRLETMNVVEVSNSEIDALYTKRGYSRGKGGFGSTDNKGK